MQNHRNLIITTGGTIGGKVSRSMLEGETIYTCDQFTEILSDTILSIRNVHGIEVTIDHCSICDIDSSDIETKHWIDIANKIIDSYDEFDSFIITHGTNTMGYTCSALSFIFANNGKPIVVTGSQVPAGMPANDAKTNLENALRVSVMKSHGHSFKGVVAVFGSHIITGTRVKKTTEFDYDAFRSFQTGSIGRIGRIIDIDYHNLEKHNSYLQNSRYPIASSSRDLIYQNNFDMRIISFNEFPGMDDSVFKTLVERHDVKGFILRAFGAGDANSSLIPAFEFLKESQIPIVVTTQAPNGNSNFQVNEPGAFLRENNLAIPAYDMSIESITTKLSWLLAKRQALTITYEQIGEHMVTDLRGEINVLWEVKI